MQDLRDCCHSITFKIGDKKGADSFESTPLAEMVGFEPTCPVKDKTISSRSRYDHFDTSP